MYIFDSIALLLQLLAHEFDGKGVWVTATALENLFILHLIYSGTSIQQYMVN